MLSNISEAVMRFMTRFEREEGQGLAEYGLIIALVSIAAVVALGLLAGAITGVFGNIQGVLNGAV